MNPINYGRFFLGGLVAGTLIFILTGMMNGAILKVPLGNWMQAAGGLLHPPAMSVSMSLWTAMSFIYGFAGVWIYVGIRPRFGAGLRTAFLSVLVLWIAGKMTAAFDLIALGLIPVGIVSAQLVGSFVILLTAVLLGAWLYKE